jgi:hypothetical protein
MLFKKINKYICTDLLCENFNLTKPIPGFCRGKNFLQMKPQEDGLIKRLGVDLLYCFHPETHTKSIECIYI